MVPWRIEGVHVNRDAMNKTYTVIPDFLLDYQDLNLTEVVALSVIFGFSMDGASEFRGSYSYLARKCKCSRQWAISTVASLIKKGYVTKKVDDVNGVRMVSLKAVFPGQESLPAVNSVDQRGVVKKVDHQSTLSTEVVNSVDGGGQLSLPNNIKENIYKNITHTARASEDSSMFYISSVERDTVGYQPDAVAQLKRERLRKAVEDLAATGDSRYAMTPLQISRFVNYWGARLRQTDRVRAEQDEYFILPAKIESWVLGDKVKDVAKAASSAVPVAPVDARPISERLTKI